MTFCANCGNKLTEGARFCENCGSPVAGAPAPAPQLHQAALTPSSAQAPAAYAAPHAAENVLPTEAGKPGGWLIPVGYIFAILGGLIGIAIGGVMWRSKEKLPSGEKVSRYDARSRRHGLIIFIISIVMVIILKNMR